MRYLLDTDVISSYGKGKMNPRVDAWLARVDDRDLHISIITYAELWCGASLLPIGKKRTEIETWIEDDLEMQFFNQCVFFGVKRHATTADYRHALRRTATPLAC